MCEENVSLEVKVKAVLAYSCGYNDCIVIIRSFLNGHRNAQPMDTH